MDEELCCEVESVDLWVAVEGEGGPPMTVEALETKVDTNSFLGFSPTRT